MIFTSTVICIPCDTHTKKRAKNQSWNRDCLLYCDIMTVFGRGLTFYITFSFLFSNSGLLFLV